ncbi:hypothetical protein AHiyo8_58550 [Arthrobacter sp. Hiyo8]|nr:hypothetical protein AHiyo8_58550 [Arthrobacter sp. Hiyo8]
MLTGGWEPLYEEIAGYLQETAPSTALRLEDTGLMTQLKETGSSAPSSRMPAAQDQSRLPDQFRFPDAASRFPAGTSSSGK